MNSCLAAMAGLHMAAPSNLSLGCEVKSRHCEGVTIKFVRFPAPFKPGTGKLNTRLFSVGSFSVGSRDGSDKSVGGSVPQAVGASAHHCELVAHRGSGFPCGAVSTSVNLSFTQSSTTSSPYLCSSSYSTLSSSSSPFLSSYSSSLIAREGGHAVNASLQHCLLSPSTTSSSELHPRVTASVSPSPSLSTSRLCCTQSAARRAVARRSTAVARRSTAVARRSTAVARRSTAVARRSTAVARRSTAVARRSTAVRCSASSSAGGGGEGGYKEYRGGISGEGLRFGVVVGLFNDLITQPLLAGALGTFKRHGVVDGDVEIAYVPGSFEIPIVAQAMARSAKFDAILCIGAVIRGSTTHYDAVAGAAASGILNASLSTSVPCVFGVLTCETMDQAMDRAGGKLGNKGAEAAATAVEMANLMKSLRVDDVPSS